MGSGKPQWGSENMKQTVYGLTSGTILIFFLVILMSLYSRNARQTEVRNALSDAVNMALSDVKKEDIGEDMDVNTFIGHFLRALCVQMNSTSDVKVNILEADPKLGILSVEVVEVYSHSNGNKGTVSTVRTVIFDEEEPEQKLTYRANYYFADNTLYKSYSVMEGNMVPVPLSPTTEGKIFQGWKFRSGGTGTATGVSTVNGTKQVLADEGGNTIALLEDISLEAVFR